MGNYVNPYSQWLCVTPGTWNCSSLPILRLLCETQTQLCSCQDYTCTCWHSPAHGSSWTYYRGVLRNIYAKVFFFASSRGIHPLSICTFASLHPWLAFFTSHCQALGTVSSCELITAGHTKFTNILKMCFLLNRKFCPFLLGRRLFGTWSIVLSSCYFYKNEARPQ